MNLLIQNLIILCFSTLISYILLLKIIPFLTLDVPNSRSSHIRPVYRGGGLIFIFITFLSIPLTKFYSLLFLLPLIVISYLDDLLTISSKIRYLIQFLTVFFILNFFLNLPIDNYFFYIVLIVAGTGVINFTNFVDGIDGLVASNMIITFTHILIMNQNNNLYPLIGGLIAFLVLNKSPAKVFMGDVGSTFLGAIFFMEIIKLSEYKIAFLSAAVTLPIYLDAFLCILARIVNKQNIFISHKKHLYQRLASSGMNHNNIATLYCICSLLIAFSSYTYNLSIVFMVIIFVLMIGLFLNKFYATPFLEE